MYNFVYDSEYTAAIIFLLGFVVFENLFEGAVLLTDIYNRRLHTDFTVSRFLISRFTSFVTSGLVAILLQLIVNLNPEAFAFTPPTDTSIIREITLGTAVASVLFGVMFSAAGLSRYASKTSKP